MLIWMFCVDISCYADFIDECPGRTFVELQNFVEGQKSRSIRLDLFIFAELPGFAVKASSSSFAQGRGVEEVRAEAGTSRHGKSSYSRKLESLLLDTRGWRILESVPVL